MVGKEKRWNERIEKRELKYVCLCRCNEDERMSEYRVRVFEFLKSDGVTDKLQTERVRENVSGRHAG